MKRFLFLLASALLTVGPVFITPGCTIRWVVNPAATPVPFPNAWHIEVRVREQLNRISAALQAGNLTQESAGVLAQNDALVRRFVREFQGPPDQTADLNYQQMVQLDNMLNDSAQFIDDAVQRRQDWAQYFQGGGFDYTAAPDRYVYISYLDYQLGRQQATIDSAVKSGQLTSIQAQELRSRIKAVRDMKINCYRANGRFDLSQDQVRQLSQMTEENSRYLRFRLKGGHGHWDKEKFNAWKNRTPQGLDQGGRWGGDQNHNWAGNQSGGFSPSQSSTTLPDGGAPKVNGGVKSYAPDPQSPSTAPSIRSQNTIGGANNPRPDLAPRSVTVAALTPVSAVKPAPVGPAPTQVPLAAAIPTAFPIAKPEFINAQPAQPPVAASVPVSPSPKAMRTAPGPNPSLVAIRLRLLPPGQLVSFLGREDLIVQKSVDSKQMTDAQTAALQQKLKDLHQRAATDLKQNQSNSVTSDQMAQLAQMAIGIDQFLKSAITPTATVPAPGNNKP